jgi:flagellar FliL protein
LSSDIAANLDINAREQQQMAAKPALKSVEPAKGKAAAAPVDAGVAAPKKKGKLPLIVGLLVLVLSASGGAAWYFLHGNPPSTDKHDVVEKEKKLALYVPLEAFTVNLQGQGDHYLQVGITLQVADNGAADEVKQQMPLIRNRLLLLLSAQAPAELGTVEGKQKLSAQVLAESRQLLLAKTPEEGIQNVLFSSFVIQ